MTASFRVLLVDDHPRLRELYKLALMDEPRLEVVAEANDGETGARLAKETRPDLVVLDLSMPKRDGLQALHEIKSSVPEARICVLSGFMRERVEPLVLEMGANRYVEKGVHASELAGILLMVAQDAPRAPTRKVTRSELELRAASLI